MKKLVFIMPLMAVSLLASCGGSKEPVKVSYTLTYTYDNGSADKYVETYDEDKKTVKPTWVPENPGYTFDGWFTKSGTEGDLFTFGDTLTTDTVIFAHWTSVAPTTYTVTFDAGDGKFLNDEQKISFKLDSGTKLLPYIKALTPTLEDQTFAYYEYEGKNNAIDYDDVVTSDITLKANYFEITAPLTDLDLPKNISWEEIKAVAITNCNPSSCFKIGATKKVQLKHQDSEGDGTDKITEGELYQTVRIIGFNEDYTELPEPGEDPDPNKSIGITFEFADLISDENGYSLATYWNDTNTTEGSNYSYKDSTIRKALNGTTNDINWFRYYGAGEDTPGTGLNRKFVSDADYKKSILNMLPDDLTKDGILKTTSKYININDGNDWKEETVNDKLFLLSPFEMGNSTRSVYEEAHTTTYSYYKGAGYSKRIKKQVIGSDEARTNSVNGTDLDGEYKGGSKYSYAGYNNSDAQYGAFLWLRSPYSSYADNSWFVHDNGHTVNYYVYSEACGVAPAFCI